MTGNDLRVRREKLEVTQEALARSLEVSLSTLSRWEQLRANEIPNSKVLDLALLALETLNFHVLEYSHTQEAFHVHTVRDMIEANVETILSKDKSSDFLPISISPYRDDLTPLREKFSERLKELVVEREEHRKEERIKEFDRKYKAGADNTPKLKGS